MEDATERNHAMKGTFRRATTAMKEYICWLQQGEGIESVRHVLQWRDGELVDLGK
jgi:hypothetical protein